MVSHKNPKKCFHRGKNVQNKSLQILSIYVVGHHIQNKFNSPFNIIKKCKGIRIWLLTLKILGKCPDPMEWIRVLTKERIRVRMSKSGSASIAFPTAVNPYFSY